MKSVFSILLFIALVFTGFGLFADTKNPIKSEVKSKVKKKASVDHTKFEVLQKNFKTGEELTNACLTCHNMTDEAFRKSIHWTWNALTGEKKYGKLKNTINNFCISTNRGNDKSCLDCHTGWGREMESVNCEVCHNQTEFNFEEAFSDIGSLLEMGDEDSEYMASEIQSEVISSACKVSLPSRKNCGSCHFYGGGGDGVKHGDLDSSLVNPGKELDVHMSPDGGDFTCTRCHTTDHHNISGRVYNKPAVKDEKSLIEDDRADRISCVSCHSASPHEKAKLNQHTKRVACQTCHIPSFARKNPTKMEWDWSTAGKKKDGKPFTTEDEFGKHDYMSIKGKFKWEKNVVPKYYWYNGSIESITSSDIIDPEKKTAVSRPVGSFDDKDSKIHPFKVHKSIQPYDKVNNKLLTPLLSGDEGYWATFDWESSLKKGAELSGQEFSGEFGFTETSYVFPITHMVTTAENALSCNQCHVRSNGRLEKLKSFYMPGRDSFKGINKYGWLIIIASLVAVIIHGGIRFVTGASKKKEIVVLDDKLYLYGLYERLWHWFQMALIFTLVVTGLEIHGMYEIFGFEKASSIHNTAGFTWVFAFVIFIFWLFSTGEWRQYKPTTRKMVSVGFYYSLGIFFGMKHPFKKTKDAKHNPVQRLTYLVLVFIILPVQILSGLVYYYYNSLSISGSLNLENIAFVHVLTALIIICFAVVHVYMTTTGPSLFAYIKSMIVGFERETIEKKKKDKDE